jgi:hypothetical protein
MRMRMRRPSYTTATTIIADADRQTCGICMGAGARAAAPCGHPGAHFHEACLIEWSVMHARCPHCNASDTTGTVGRLVKWWVASGGVGSCCWRGDPLFVAIAEGQVRYDGHDCLSLFLVGKSSYFGFWGCCVWDRGRRETQTPSDVLRARCCARCLKPSGVRASCDAVFARSKWRPCTIRIG